MTSQDARRICLLLAVMAMACTSAAAQAQSITQPQQSQPAPAQGQPSSPSQSQQDQPAQEQSNSQQKPDQSESAQPQNQQNPPAQEPSRQPENPPQNQSPQGEPQQSPPAQNQPPAEEKKDDNPNPAQAAVDATKDAAAQAVQATKQVAQETLIKVRDWETGWVAGVYVGKNRPLVAMDGWQRRDIYLQQTFTRPGDYIKRMFAAGIDQARGAPAEWGGGFGGYGKRFASREGQFIAANSLAALANAKLKYEPRYDQCRCGGFGPRLRHAILRNFLTYNQTEQELRPQLGLYGGAFAGGVISMAWKPHPRSAFAEGGFAMLGQAGYGALLNVFIEFSGDINRKLWGRK
jgi:hypothetical protein